MICPRCDAELLERERSGITIDFCSSCRGVWLDRGELENLVTREQSYYDGRDRDRNVDRGQGGRDRRDRDNDDDDDDGPGGFLRNIMDMVGGGN